VTSTYRWLARFSLNDLVAGYVIQGIGATCQRTEDVVIKRLLAPAGLVTAALIAAGCGSSGGSGSASGSGGSGSTQPAAASGNTASGNTVKTAKVDGATVLTNAQGFVLYWFAPDTSATSKCNGSCATFWPPMKGPVSGSGIKGTFGTITRSDGSKQATFDGHPLYTYKGDSKPDEASGNGVNINGGLWHEVTASGSAAASNPSTSPTTGSGGGGYGY
jgi:predicted lipoprotein with Yx(FWY)xxD motif